MSKKKEPYRTANDAPVYNLGIRKMNGLTAEWEPLAPAGLAGLLAPPPNPACTGLSGR